VSLVLSFSDGESGRIRIQIFENVFRDIRFIGLIEEHLWEVRKCFIDQIIVLEGFSKSRRKGLEVPQPTATSKFTFATVISDVVK
jgi:hypothetical protein